MSDRVYVNITTHRLVQIVRIVVETVRQAETREDVADRCRSTLSVADRCRLLELATEILEGLRRRGRMSAPVTEAMRECLSEAQAVAREAATARLNDITRASRLYQGVFHFGQDDNETVSEEDDDL